MTSHTIQYEGIEFTVYGEYEQPEENYKGGWSTSLIKVNDVDLIWMLKDDVIDRISEIVVEENY